MIEVSPSKIDTIRLSGQFWKKPIGEDEEFRVVPTDTTEGVLDVIVSSDIESLHKSYAITEIKSSTLTTAFRFISEDLEKYILISSPPKAPIHFLYNVHKYVKEVQKKKDVLKPTKKRKYTKKNTRESNHHFTHRSVSSLGLLIWKKTNGVYSIGQKDVALILPSDFVFKVGETEEEFHVHSAVISNFEFWQALLNDTHKWKEHDKKEMVLPDVNPKTFKYIISYLYGTPIIDLIDQLYSDAATLGYLNKRIEILKEVKEIASFFCLMQLVKYLSSLISYIQLKVFRLEEQELINSVALSIPKIINASSLKNLQVPLPSPPYSPCLLTPCTMKDRSTPFYDASVSVRDVMIPVNRAVLFSRSLFCRLYANKKDETIHVEFPKLSASFFTLWFTFMHQNEMGSYVYNNDLRVNKKQYDDLCKIIEKEILFSLPFLQIEGGLLENWNKWGKLWFSAFLENPIEFLDSGLDFPIVTELHIDSPLEEKILKYIPDSFFFHCIRLNIHEEGAIENPSSFFRKLKNSKSLSLKKLTIACDKITTTETLGILKNRISELKVLELIDAHLLSDKALSFFIDRTEKLEKLKITNAANVSDKALQELIKKNPNLNYIQLKGCRDVSDGVINMIVETCKDLEFLDISECSGISSETFECLNNCLFLHELVITPDHFSLFDYFADISMEGSLSSEDRAKIFFFFEDFFSWYPNINFLRATNMDESMLDNQVFYNFGSTHCVQINNKEILFIE